MPAAGGAWGLFSQKTEGGGTTAWSGAGPRGRSYGVEVRHGAVTLARLALAGDVPQQVTVEAAGRTVDAMVERREAGWTAALADPVTLSEGEDLRVVAT